MSCWVVPSLAAEIWHVPVEQVWERIERGEIETRQENGFTFVDVAPYGPKLSRPNLPPAQRPATFTVAATDPAGDSEAELDALEAELAPLLAAGAEEEDERGPEDETASQELGDWRTARRRTARLRVPPLKWRMSA